RLRNTRKTSTRMPTRQTGMSAPRTSGGACRRSSVKKLKIQLPAVDLASRRPNFQNSENQTSKTIYSPDGAGPKPPPHRTYRADREKKRLYARCRSSGPLWLNTPKSIALPFGEGTRRPAGSCSPYHGTTGRQEIAG